MNYDIINYFYERAIEYGFVNLVYDPRCKIRKDVDNYMSNTNKKIGDPLYRHMP